MFNQSPGPVPSPRAAHWMRAAAFLLLLAMLAGCAPDPKAVFTPTPTRTYDKTNLASLLSDQAPLVLTYGFEQVEVQQFAGPNNLKVSIEIFKLSDAANAYGLWTRLCGGKPFKIGNDGCSDGQLQLGFWQDQYMVNVLASTVASPELLESFGNSIGSKLPKGGVKPSVVAMAPSKNMAKGGLIYFHEQVATEKVLSLGTDNLLGLSAKTGCVLAQYDLDGEKAELLLIDYPDEAAAASGLKTLQNAGLPDMLVAGYKGKFIGAVFGVAKADAAAQLLGEALK